MKRIEVRIDVCLFVTLGLEPLVVKVGGEESLVTVTEQLGACIYCYEGNLYSTEKC